MTTYNELLSAATEKGWVMWKGYEQKPSKHYELYTMTNIQKWLLDVHGIWVTAEPSYTFRNWRFLLYFKNKETLQSIYSFEQYDALREGEMEAIKQIKK